MYVKLQVHIVTGRFVKVCKVKLRVKVKFREGKG